MAEEQLRDYLKVVTAALRDTRAELRSLRHEPIAVVGMGCRYPGGVDSPEALWRLVADGADAIAGFPADRGWDTAGLYAGAEQPGSTTREGGFVYDAADFDADFFGISPREALAMDPHQRLLLETSWEAVERAGIDPTTLRGSLTGVFAGVYSSAASYGSAQGLDFAPATDHLLTGTANSVLSGRISFALGLVGPSVTVDTACSSSLVALHLAVRALRAGECELALAGGVTIMSSPTLFQQFSRQRGLAADGRCKPFAADADGTGWGEGAGMIALERVSDARRRGHPILAVIRGSAVNQDGASNGLTAPNGPSQRAVIRSALENAQLTAADVDAVEAHGTGTRLGDPIEAGALLGTYGQADGRASDRPLWLGSVKANIGHTQAAAGAAGLIKMVMALRHGVLPRSLHAERPSQHVDWKSGHVRLLSESVDWPQRADGTLRRAAVSAFGISGTNAHLVIEESPAEIEAPEQDEPATPVLPSASAWVLSGRTPAALAAQARKLGGYFEAGTEPADAAIAWSLATTRTAFDHRAVVLDQVAGGLAALAAGKPAAGVVTGEVRSESTGRTVFVFPGQGSQWIGMGRELAATSPCFAARLAECAAALAPYVEWELDDVLAGRHGFEAADVVQPALWAVLVSLAAVWEAAGVRPDAVVGHSQGEIAAAVVAGSLSLDDAAKVVALRSRILTALAGRGGMMAVEAAPGTVRRWLEAYENRVSVAAVNGPSATVVAGDPDALRELAAEHPTIRTRVLPVDYASHSAHVDELHEEIIAALTGIEPRPARLPMISTRSGEWLAGPELDPAYWYAGLRETVEFARAVRVLGDDGHDVFIEVSPHPVLAAAIGEELADRDPVVVGTLRRDDGGSPRLLASLGEAYVHGAPVDWTAVLPRTERVDLPTYAFQRVRFWPRRIDPAPATGPVPTDDTWRYRTAWEPLGPAGAAALTGTWAIVTRDGTDPEPFVRALTSYGAETVVVSTEAVERAAIDAAQFARIPAPAGVLSLLALDSGPLPGRPAVPHGTAATLALLQALGDAALTAPLWTVTRGAVAAVPGDAPPVPGRAQVWGLGRVAALEYPNRWGGLIDLPAELDDRTAAHLAAVVADGAEDQVALRRAGAFARRLERAPRAAPPPGGPAGDWTPRGTVLVTGGTGSIGPYLTSWLAERGAPRVVVPTRSGPSPALAAHTAALAAAGTTVEVVACDIADRAAVAGMLSGIARNGPRLSTVMHAANAFHLTRLEDTDLAGLAASLAGKAAGADHLDELVTEADEFILFSSIAAAWGSAEHGAYAAANAHLDALAERRVARGGSGLSLGWGVWDTRDWAAPDAFGPHGPATITGESLQRQGTRFLAPGPAMDTLGRILTDGPGVTGAYLALADIDWAQFAPVFTAARRSALLERIPEARVALDDSAAPIAPTATVTAAAGGDFARRLTAVTATPERERLATDLVRTHAAAVLGHRDASEVSGRRAFRDLGFDSLTAVELRKRLASATDLKLKSSIVFEHPTPAALGAYLAAAALGVEAVAAAPVPGPPAADPGEPLAIVGIGCRFPGGVATPEQYWDLLAAGADVIGALPADRGWDAALYHPDPERLGRTTTRAGGFLYDAPQFDAGFFGINPREAIAMDPQQRLLLETSWEALERAGIAPDSLRGTPVGVFAGATLTGYGAGLPAEDPAAEGYLVTGHSSSIISGRVAYALGLEGPAVTIDTACSSALVALHLAGQALRAGECALALVGGVMVMSTPSQLVGFSRQRGLATDGRCKPFAAGADGMGLSEGAATIAVERLSDARRHGHPVLAVVRGTAVNQDGASNGLTAPNGLSQQRVIRAALDAAGLTPDQVDAVEAHGTGTPLGDPVEAHALLATYGRHRPADRPLWLGSAKSNIGHTQTAAGLAGLIKMVLAMRHGTLPLTLHADEPSHEIDWESGGVRLLTEQRSWTVRGGASRRAGVSAFGMSGTNVHVIIEQLDEAAEPTYADTAAPAGPALLVPLTGVTAWPITARSRTALAAQAGRLREFVLAPAAPAPDVTAWSLATTRSHFEHRAVAIGADRAEFGRELAALMSGGHERVGDSDARDDRTVFVFPGQGSQWAGMGRQLLAESPVFAVRFAECAEALRPHVSWDPYAVLDGDDNAPTLERAAVMQPVLWAVMVSLAAVWQAAGVRPDMVVGHSQGEIAAATVAGVLSLKDGARVVAVRAQAVAGLGVEGGMLSVVMPVAAVRELLEPYGDRLAVAAVNSPAMTVVSGEPDALLAFERELRKLKVMRWRVPVTDFVAHSRLCEPLAATLPGLLAGIVPQPGEVAFLSTVHGRVVHGSELGPEYWYANVRGTVRFADAVVALARSGHRAFVEVSAHPVLLSAVEEVLVERPDLPTPVLIDTLRRDDGGAHRLLRSLGTAFVHGLPVDWATVLNATTEVRIAARQSELPTYAFQHVRYWPKPAVELPAAAAPTGDPAELTDGWRFVTEWAHTPEPAPVAFAGTWLVLIPAGSTTHPSVAALARRGADLVTVELATAEPDRADYAARIAAVLDGTEPAGVLSLLALDAGPLAAHPSVGRGLAATLAVVQALGDTGTRAALWVLTVGAVTTDPGTSESDKWQASIWALGRTVAAEHPDRWGGLVDLPPAGGQFDDRIGAHLAAVLAARDENEVALRPGGLRRRRLAHAPKPPAAAERRRLNPRGTVLITGGTGHIGGHAARWLAAERGARRIVLTSRSGPAAADTAALAAALAAAGAMVDVLACDTAERPALAAVLDRIAATGPELSTVLHAAGALDDGVLDHLDATRLANTFDGKAGGAAALDELTAHLDLDAFILCSSISATFGNGGQGNYAAANAYLDALAEQRRARGKAATSIAWGPWAEGGVGQASEGARQRLARNKWEVLMRPADAIQALAAAVEDTDPRLAVVSIMAVDFAAMATARGPEQLRRAPLMRDLPEIRAADEADAASVQPGTSGPATPLAVRLGALTSADAQERLLRELVRDETAIVLGYPSVADIEPGRAFSELGLDSLTSVELRNRLGVATGLTLPATLLYDYPDPDVLAAHLRTEVAGRTHPEAGGEPAVTRPGPADPLADPIAIVAMGCRLPGDVHTPEQLWQLLADGRDAITGLPTDRGWDVAGLYDPDPDRPGTLYARGGGFLHDAADFDATFFGISPREALAMDPQQRLLLEVVWETIERGGIDPAHLRGSRTGVFVGGFGSGYDLLTANAAQPDGRLEGQAMIGTATSVLAGRISYLLGLEGPAFTVDTACSSSLVALHSAGQALRADECDLALVGGVTVMATPRDLIGFSRQRGLAADGRCKAFGTGADGMGMAEGVGVLAVERLSDARRNGHQVLALVRGSAVNQDGASNGLTAPSGPAQQRVIRAALANARLAPADVDAAEAHGTGTELGDPIEAQALLATYGQERPADRPLWLGSVKSNIGHTQAAAGVAGIIKTVLALRHGLLPRTLHADIPSPHVDWSTGHVALLHEPVDWAPRDDRPRRAGVSSFGVSGTNAHVIIEEPPATPAAEAGTAVLPVLSDGPVAWPVTARGRRALAGQAARLRESVVARPDLGIGDLAWSLATTRSAFAQRAVVIGADRTELAAGLAAVATGQPGDGVVTGSAAAAGAGGGSGRTVFVFPGHGSQWVGMGRELAAGSPVFAARLAECAAALAPYVDWELDDVLAGRHDFRAADVLQPALWAVTVSLAAVWRAAGVRPDAVVGHSLGEIAAATVAGVLTLEDGAKVAALRARALRTLDGRGGMLSVAEPADVVRERLTGFAGRLSLATVNGPRSSVVSGNLDALDEFAAMCPPTCRTTRVPIAYASHSTQVEELRAEILTALAGIEPRASEVPLLSAFTGEWLAGPEMDAHYWYASLRGTVEFETAIRTLGASGHSVFVEVSGHPALIGAIGDTLGDAAVVTGTLRRDDGGVRRLLTSLATAYVSGLPVDWAAVHGPGRPVDLPTYAFQRTRYWPAAAQPAVAATADPLTGLRYRITWTRVADSDRTPAVSGTWLLVGGYASPAAADQVSRTLTEHGAAEVVGVADIAGLRGRPDQPIAGVVSLLALDESPEHGHPTMTRGVAATLDLIQVLGTGAPEAPLWVLTSGALATDPGDVGRPAQAQIWGLGRVAGLEHPERWGGLIDLPAAGWDARTGARLAAVLSGAIREDQSALRPQGVLARRLVRAGAPVARTGSARPGRGTVLVTGGTGAIGSEVGRWLAGRGAERVVLAGTEPLTADVARLAADVAAFGAELAVTACDTTRRDEVEALLRQIAADGGPALRSVVHAVGVGQATAVADITAEELATVAGARSAGARWLDELTAEMDLDDFVLFSSVAATWGSALVPGYAMGSAFVDALAEQRRARGQVATSVAWGPWAATTAATTPSSVRHGLGGLDPQVAVRALGQALDGGDALVTIADVDWRTFAPAFTLHRPSPLLADLPEAAMPAATRTDADGDTPEFARTLRALPAARRLAAAIELVREESARVLSHSGAADIDADRAFRDLGFDSLTAIELRNRLAAASGAVLPSTVVFEYPTPAELAAHLLRAIGAGPDSVLDELARLDTTLSDLLDRLDEDGSAPAGPGEDDEAVAAHLAALTDKFRRLRRRATGTGTGPDVSERLDGADDDEVFDLLGKEFGIR